MSFLDFIGYAFLGGMGVALIIMLGFIVTMLIWDIIDTFTAARNPRRHMLTREQRHAADLKAATLLKQHLTPDQIKMLESYLYFKVVGNKTGRTYTIFPYAVYNILRDDNVNYCIASKDHDIPLYDTMLAQKMLIECDEEYFLRKANRGV